MKKVPGDDQQWKLMALKDEGGILIIEPKGLKVTREWYIEKLFNDGCFLSQQPEGGDLEILEILPDEVRKVVDQAKNGKVPGSDQIPAELIKLLNEHGMNKLAKLCNHIHQI